jgi:hypothetical protein
MLSWRALLFRNASLAFLLVLAALFVRAIVPAGYMPAAQSRSFTVMLCADQNATSMRVAIPIDGLSLPHEGKSDHASDSPCSFGGLAMGATGFADAALLAVALAHVISLGFAPVEVPTLQGFFYLRPPLRGPPLYS